MSAGLITIAYGSRKYIRMAQALALSYRRWSPALPFCVVTDAAHAEEMSRYFDVVRIIDLSYGKGVSQKLSVDRYSPFDETLFVDSDCVFYKDPARSWKAHATGDFVIKGWNYIGPEGKHGKIKNLAALFEKTGISRMGGLNSGMFYFRQGELADRLFAKSRELYERRDELGFKPFKNAPVAVDPLIAVAMEICGIEMREWDPATGMETWLNMRDMQAVNVIRGRSRVTKNGKALDPAVIHYHVGGQISLAYLRDIFRLVYENEPLAEGRARISARWFWLWYLPEKIVRAVIRRCKALYSFVVAQPLVGGFQAKRD